MEKEAPLGKEFLMRWYYAFFAYPLNLIELQHASFRAWLSWMSRFRAPRPDVPANVVFFDRRRAEKGK